MKPKLYVDYKKSIITTGLVQEMSLKEVREFLEKFKMTVEKFTEDGVSFSVLNDAAEKSFTDLDAVREFSQEVREILKNSNVNKVAIYRPQDDFHSDEELAQPDKIKFFITLEGARTWLLQK